MNNQLNVSRIVNLLFLLFLIVLALLGFTPLPLTTLEVIIFSVTVALAAAGLNWWLGVFWDFAGQLFVVCLAIAFWIGSELAGLTNFLPAALFPYAAILYFAFVVAGMYGLLIRRPFPY